MPKYFTRLTGTGAFYTSGSWASASTLASALSIGSNCVPPKSNDEAFILVGKCNISNNLTNTASAFTGSLTIGAGFDGTIGTAAGTPLKTNCLLVEHGGSGAFVNFSGDSSDNVSEYRFFGPGQAYVRASTFTSGKPLVYVGPGARVEFENGANLDDLKNAGGFVSIGTSGAVDVTNYDGSVELNGPVTGTLDVRGGDVVAYGTTTMPGLVYVGNGARYNHASVGTIDYLEVFPNGTVSDRGAPGPFTVSGNVWPNSSFFENPQVRITATVGRRGMP